MRNKWPMEMGTERRNRCRNWECTSASTRRGNRGDLNMSLYAFRHVQLDQLPCQQWDHFQFNMEFICQCCYRRRIVRKQTLLLCMSAEIDFLFFFLKRSNVRRWFMSISPCLRFVVNYLCATRARTIDRNIIEFAFSLHMAKRMAKK